MPSFIPLVLVWALVLATVVRTTPHPEVGPQPGVDKSIGDITKDLQGYVLSALGANTANWEGAWSAQLTFNRTFDTQAPIALFDTLQAISKEVTTHDYYWFQGRAPALVVGNFDTRGYMSFANELTLKTVVGNARQLGLAPIVRAGVITAKDCWKSACQALLGRMPSADPSTKKLHTGCLYIDGRLGLVEAAYG
ncbi:hypothetical protein CBOM_03066 [Ceraceosorus bombacis]|uniref:Uncharacterized protein n=1 Tax=Ceraceosorus bombacis TaxID=401625 RepID=A0A0P1BMR3_9BASI|nr:hypothetical protein CBOM_03066 [Ceraceosorus bombacis]